MSDRLLSDAEVDNAISGFKDGFQGKIAHRIYHLGDKAGVVVSPSDPSLYNATDESGSPTRVRRKDLSETTPAGTAIYVGETQGHQDTYDQEYGIAIPQIGNYAGQTYKTAWVGPLKIAVGSATSGNIIGSTFLTYDDTVNQIDLYGNSSPAIAIHSFGVRGAFTSYAANGVKGAPTAITSGQEILRCFSAFGYGTTMYLPNSVGRIGVWSTQAFTDTVSGTELRFSSTPKGGNVPTVGLILQDDQRLAPQAGIVYKRRAVADTNTTITAADYIVGYSSLTAGRTVALTAAATLTVGSAFIVKDEAGTAAANNLTVDPAGTETIDGAATKAITTNYGSLTFYTDGSNWFTIS